MIPLEVQLQAWSLALGIACAAMLPLLLWTRWEAKRNAAREDVREKAMAILNRQLARTWRSRVHYDVTEDADVAKEIRAALDRHDGIALGLNVDQIHALCDMADKMRAENVTANGGNNDT